MRRSTARMAAIAAALAALVAGITLAIRFSDSPAPLAANALFEQTFEDADGRPQPLNQWKGRLLVVNFWATWCAPCVDEMPELDVIHKDFAQRGVTVIGVAIDNSRAVKQFRDRLQLQLPLLVAGGAGNEVGKQLGNAAGVLPYTVLVNRRGEVSRAKLGRVREHELRSWLNAALADTSR